MISVSMQFSVLLLTAGTSAVACALYANQGTMRHRLNKLLLAIGVSILLWGFGLGLRVSAEGPAAAWAGSFIAPLGYSMLFGYLLHYVLLLSGHEELLKRRWLYLPIYLPGIVTAFGLSVLPLLGYCPFSLAHTSLGWVNNTWNFWIAFYYVYWLVFIVVISVLLLQWAKRAKDSGLPLQRRQARLFFCSILAMVVLGSATDVVLPYVYHPLPGVAVCFAMLPIISVCYSVKRLGFMHFEKPNPDETILNKASLIKTIYAILGGYFLAASAINIVQAAAAGNVRRDTLVFSGVLLVGGLLVWTLNRFLRDDAVKELLLAFLFAAFIPLITFRYARYGGVTIWTFVFLLMVSSMLFNRRILLVSILLSAFQAQLVLLAAVPRAKADLNASALIVRLGLIVLTAGLAYFVSMVYRRRLQENAKHAARQKTAAEISRALLPADVDNWETVIGRAFGCCAGFFRFDWASLVLLDEKGDPCGPFCEWPGGVGAAAEKERSVVSKLVKMPAEGNVLRFSAADAEDGPFKRALLAAGIRFFVSAPLLRDGKRTGALCLYFRRHVPEWDRKSSDFLRLVANMVSDTLTKLDSVRKVQHIAYHDQLTGLPNRRMLQDRLTQAMTLAGRTAKMIGVVFLDIDSFKSINDTMGHEAGDRLLVRLASELSHCVRRYDTVARIGGDEFVLLLNQISSVADIRRIMDKIMGVVRRPVVLQDQEFFVTGSAGVSLYPQDGEDAETLISNADIAMYRAKAKGKNNYVLCSQDMKDEMIEQMKMTNLLYRAQEKDQLVVYYQPQVNLATGGITGLEALLRWRLPGKGLVSPGVFIPLAEKTGLILPIGRWVLETACRQSVLWWERGFFPVRMAVNVSVQQLLAGDFVRQVADVLQKTGLSASQLELEITESVANSGVPGLPRTFAELKDLGVSLSIDDFGTEYSSLSRLKLLPVDRLKLDIQFVRGIESSEKDRAITKTIISLAKNLNMKIVAEGVETEAQLDFLNQRMCDEVQGFYYYKPMPAKTVETYLRRADGV